ncbi:MAG: Ig-like domain-containing protein, partial [Anaerolineae bacterium]
MLQRTASRSKSTLLSIGIVLLLALSIAVAGEHLWGATASAGIPVADGPTTPQKLAIPSYFYPDRSGGAGQLLWNRMIAGYPTVGLVIANPGLYGLQDPRIDPAPRANYDDPNYRAQVQESQAAGQLVLGYTHTSYGGRDPYMVKSDIDLLYRLFNVDGIFLDEAPTDCGNLAYFQDLYTYIKNKTLPDGSPVHGKLVVLNPGTQTAECYMAVSDIILTFEGYYNDPGPGIPAGQWYRDNYLAPAWVSDYPASRFWHLVHTTGTVEEMVQAVHLSKDRHAGWIYVTPDAMDNPWDTLPPDSDPGSYWAEELTAVRPLPEPPPPTCVEPPDGLVAWWPADGNAGDIVGANNGAIRMDPGSPFSPFTVGKVGQAFNLGFSGYSDHISLGSGPSITGQGPFAVEAWVAATGYTNGVIIQQRDVDGYNGEYVLRLGPVGGTPGHVCWMTYGDNAYGFNFCSNAQVNDGVFHHIVAVRESDGAGKIYIDGVLDNQMTGDSRTLISLGVFVGADMRDGAAYLKGFIDEVAIYNRALSSQEIAAIFNADTAGKCKHIVPVQVAADFQTVTRELENPPLPGLNTILDVSGVAAPGGDNTVLFSADLFAALPAFAAVSDSDTRPRVRTVFPLERLGYDYDPSQPIANRVDFGEGLVPILVDFAPPGYTESYDARGGLDDFLQTLDRLGLDVYFTIDSIPRQPKTTCEAQVTVPVDPKGTYLHTSADDQPGAPMIVDLAARGFVPGDQLKLTYTGNFNPWSGFVGPKDVVLLGVFSNSATLLAQGEAHRVPGAVDAGADYVTSPTYFGTEPTDISEDFRLYPPYRTPEDPTGFVIGIPPGATHLFLGIGDAFFTDNVGELFVTLESPGSPSHCLASIPQAITGVNGAMKWNTSPPRDYAEWANLVERLVVDHPGIKSWAIWNEPNLPFDPPWFWRGSQAEFFELYDRTAEGLARQAGPGVEIGGYGELFVVNPWVEAFLAGPRARLDFLSYHRYSCDPADLTQAYAQMRQWQAAAGASQVPLVLEEFGLGTGTNPPCAGRMLSDEAGSNFQGTFVATSLIDLFGAGLRDAYYWDDDAWDTNQNDLVRFDREVLATCSTVGACPTNEFGSFTLRELTPLQQVLQVFARLFQTVVNATSDQPDVHVLATKSGDGQQMALVLSNFAATAKSAGVTITDLPAGAYEVSEYAVANRTISLGTGVVFDGDAALWDDKVALVRSLGRIQPNRQLLTEPINGTLVTTVDLSPYTVALVALKYVGPPNQPPAADAGGPYAVTEGGSVGLDGSASQDPEGGPLAFAWDLDGNGTFETPGQDPDFSAAGRDGPGQQTVTLQVCDAHTACTTDSTSINIANAPPAVGQITGPAAPVELNAIVSVSGSFSDPGALDTHTAAWDWGDGTTSPGAVNEAGGSGSVSGSHTYSDLGAYMVRLTVTDKDGDFGQSSFQYVIVNDPARGPVVWPISGWDVPDFPLSSTFGPRLKASASYRYDWHRGIDIPTACYTPVRAITSGVVRLAGDVSSYEDRVVQLRHYKPGRTSCSNDGCFYSNYMHLASASVQVSQTVAIGQVIGLSGETRIGSSGVCTPGVNLAVGNGFDHLHFEILDGDVYQQGATHPLRYLPYTDAGAPQLRIDGVNALNSLRPIVSLSASLPPAELDLNRVEVIAYNNSGGSLTEVDRQTFDMLDWNALYTPVNNGTSDTTILDTAPAYDGVYDGDYGVGAVSPAPLGVAVRPARFNASSAAYKLDLTFSDLDGVANAGSLVVKARAVDINGHATEVTADRIMGRATAAHAIYVWRAQATHGTPIDLAEAGRLADFAVAEGIQTIYYDNWGCGAPSPTCAVSAGIQDAATLAPIITLFHGHGLRVEALYTDNTRIANVVSYNNSAPTDARFDGLRLDIESFPGGGFGPTTAADLDVYVQAVASAGFLPVYVSISPYWNTAIAYNSQTKPAYKHILDIVAGVDVQTAQDTASAIKSITQDEVCYANALGKQIHVTIETFDVVTYLGLNPWNTFFDQGEAAMHAVLATVNYAGAPCGNPLPAGYAYHFYRQSLGSPTQRGWGTIADGDSYSTDEDVPLNIAAPGVLGNDSDAQGNALVAVSVSNPAHGSLTLNADGSFGYVSGANFHGIDSFTYQARDSTGDLSLSAVVTLTVSPVNDPPMAAGDTYTTNVGTALNLAAPGVLANDTDLDGNALSALLVSSPAHGALTLNADGSFMYTPTASYYGSDAFTYRANDGAANSNVVTVNIMVQGQPVSVAVSIKVGDRGGTGHAGYLVRVYSAAGHELGNAWSNSDGLTTFTLTTGSHYEFLVEKNGARSARIGFEPSTGQIIEYTLAKLTINVGRAGYLVRVYNGTDGSGSEWGNAGSDATGATAFYLVEGDYGYLVEKNAARSAKAGFTVARSADQTLTYTLAKLTINVGRAGYLVRVYNGTDGGGSEWGNAWS